MKRNWMYIVLAVLILAAAVAVCLIALPQPETAVVSLAPPTSAYTTATWLPTNAPSMVPTGTPIPFVPAPNPEPPTATREPSP